MGTSRDVHKRLCSLQASCPVPLRLVYYEDGGHAKEQGVHALLAEHDVRRDHGEWFEGEWEEEECRKLFSEWRDSSAQALTKAERLRYSNRVRQSLREGDLEMAQAELLSVVPMLRTPVQKRWYEKLREEYEAARTE